MEIGGIVRDGGANMHVGCSNVMTAIHCTIHLLQLVVVNGLFEKQEVKSVLQKWDQLVAFLSRSLRGMDMFRECQVSINKEH